MKKNRMNDKQIARRNKAQQAEVAETSWAMFLEDMEKAGKYTADSEA